MNGKICRYLLRFSILALCGLTATATLATPASSRSAAPQQAVAFLSAPYYGSTWLSSIFDHDVRPNHILAFTGAAAHENNCPCQPLPPEPPPNPNCSRPNFPSAYLSCDIRRYLYYDDHPGIDYVLRYAYVRAAAPGTVHGLIGRTKRITKRATAFTCASTTTSTATASPITRPSTAT